MESLVSLHDRGMELPLMYCSHLRHISQDLTNNVRCTMLRVEKSEKVRAQDVKPPAPIAGQP